MTRHLPLTTTVHSRAVLLALFAAAIALGLGNAAAADFLDPEKAFQVTALSIEDGQVEVTVRIAPGYYLYREPLRVTAAGATMGTPIIPKGVVKFDENFQKNVETYRGDLRIAVPVLKSGSSFTLQVVSQGCADAGLCYPPMTSTFTLKAPVRPAR